MKVTELFESSIVPKMVYHGTKQKFDAFKRTKGTVSTFISLEEVDRYGFFFTDNIKFASEFTPRDGVIIAAHINMKHPLDLNDGSMEDFERLAKTGYNVKAIYSRHPSDMWELFDNEEGQFFIEKLKEAGFDGVIMLEPDDSGRYQNTYVVLDTNQIKILKYMNKNQTVTESETLQLPKLKTGDTLLVGRFKNSKATIKGFKKDDKGQPVAKTDKGDQRLLKPRIPKLFPDDIKESIETVTIGNGMFSHDVKVIKNPSITQIEQLLRYIKKSNKFPHIRGYVDRTDYYIWNGLSAIHADLVISLGLHYNYENRCDIITDYGDVRFDCEYFDKFENLPIIKRLSGQLSEIINEGEKLDEASRLFSAVRLDEIPAKYKGLKVLGRGTTTIAVEKDPSTVLLFTRDSMKKEWLTTSWGLNIGTTIDSYDSNKHTIAGIREKPIFVIEMPKLYPLSSANIRKVNGLLKEFAQIKQMAQNHTDHSNRHAYDQKILQYYQHRIDKHEASQIKLSDDELLKALDPNVDISGQDFYEPHQFHVLVDFLSNYNSDQYTWDLGLRNFKQTRAGELVVLDPIADRELLNLYFSRNQNKN